MGTRRQCSVLFLAGFVMVFIACSDRSTSETPVRRPAADHDESAVVAAQGVAAVIENLQRDPISFEPSAYCLSSGELTDVVAPSDAILRAVRPLLPTAVAATECTRSGEWGSFVTKSTGNAALLLYAKAYVAGDRAFVYSGWYEHTMSARMFLLVFRRDGKTWRRESMIRLGAV